MVEFVADSLVGSVAGSSLSGPSRSNMSIGSSLGGSDDGCLDVSSSSSVTVSTWTRCLCGFSPSEEEFVDIGMALMSSGMESGEMS